MHSYMYNKKCRMTCAWHCFLGGCMRSLIGVLLAMCLWVVTSLLAGVLAGLAGVCYMGYEAARGFFVVMVVAGALTGSVGGVVFAPLVWMAWVRARTSFVWVSCAVCIGALAGVVGMAVGNMFVGPIRDECVVGSICGALIGLVCAFVGKVAFLQLGYDGK